MNKLFSLSLVAAIGLSSCCAIVNGRHADVNVRSSVPDSTVLVNGVECAKTPCIVTIKRRGAESVEVRKDGYHPYKVAIKRSGSLWLLGNVLVGGLIGLTIDLCTGSHVAIDPENIDATLTPIN